MTLPQTRFDFLAEVPAAEDLGRVHFVAIGGAGMSGVARILLAKGVPVSGSDARESTLLHALAAEGASVHVGHDAGLVDDADTVVISSAIRDDNPELRAAHTKGLPVLHRAQALAATMGGSRRVAVAGANGKTTTTSLLTVALQACGVDPSFAVGGELAKHGTNAHLGTGDVFVVEADESDGSFLVYRPEVAIVTSVQADHLDFYGDLATVEEAYRAFVGTIVKGGLLVACADDQGAKALAEVARSQGIRVLTYGESADADARLSGEVHRGLAWSAVVTMDGLEHRLRLLVPGHHNVLNATAAFVAAAAGLDQDPELVLAGLASFSGTRRRFEPKGRAAGVQVVDDYAHNPGKVAAVVETATQLVADAGSGRLVVVFQPHLYSRTRDFAPELGAGLAAADVVVVMDVYAAREDPQPGVSGRLVADAVRAARADADVRYVPSWAAVPGVVAGLLRPGDLLLTVGAGDVTMIGPEVLYRLERGEVDEVDEGAARSGRDGKGQQR
ncbi:MAG TPA: UDP-N-acetylmuramate--L-alanine ligase [Lapillicoccus sp.]|jgi:UDP-N-acetylmuramate--alanine ligase|uniref:UDP-N-acetylmuramate--L-alanine ligase n=1 Tax=Lapillicoccus sp. TaxID=1909287 RepID=UPI002F93FC72